MDVTTDGDTFAISKMQFAQQYASIYFARLVLLRSKIIERLSSSGLDERKVKLCSTLLDVDPEIDCIIVGTIYKNMKLKPCVLDEYMTDPVVNETRVSAHALTGCYVAEDDTVELEDEHARLLLTGDGINVRRLVTGVVLAVRGRLQPSSGQFQVFETIVAGVSDQAPFPVVSRDKLVVLVSGLQAGGTSILPQLLVDYITGAIGSDAERCVMRDVARVVICGDSIRERTDTTDRNEVRTKWTMKAETSQIANALQSLDLFLEQLCSSVDVDILPGPLDPTNVAVPQQPIHHLLLPRSSALATMHRITNPCSMTLDGVMVLGTSGQNVTDIADYVDGLSRLDILEQTLMWRVIAPTCPDTLYGFPFNDHDPFVIKSVPHVYFAGNQPSFDTRIVEGAHGERVRLIAVPAFATTGQVVLLNLRNLDCHVMQFSSR
ncbi:DNA polymerase delta small subunit [Plasmodiophora brassicae]|nr:hypothetical protein PBRA_000310 [Plasmodiophora brassicae]